MKKTFTVLYLILITCFGVAQTNTTARNYDVEEFNRIVIVGGGNLRIHHSDEHTLKVKSNNGCDEMVDVSVSSKILYIRVNDSGINGCGVTIEVGAPSILELVQRGGGNISIKNGFNPQDSFLCKISGGGNIDVTKLSVNNCIASIEGGGVILLNAEKELKASVAGGGSIKYSGDPKVMANISGGGSINRN